MYTTHMKKSLRVFLALCAGAALVVCIVVAVTWYQPSPSVETETAEIPSSFRLNYPSDQNFRQGLNECGPYTAAAALRMIVDTDTTSQEVVDAMHWRLPNGYTSPFGMKRVLKSFGAHVDEITTKKLTDEEKLLTLRQELSAEHPVILLGEKDGIKHYYALVGYEEDDFFVYDPLHDPLDDTLTIDSNGDDPGNRTLSEDELLTFWSTGGLGGLYEYYALVVSAGE